jgi:hypothetical protein
MSLERYLENLQRQINGLNQRLLIAQSAIVELSRDIEKLKKDIQRDKK